MYDEKTPAEEALRDQVRAYKRDYAEECLDLMDQFIRYNFTRVEAFKLTMQFIDNGIIYDAST